MRRCRAPVTAGKPMLAKTLACRLEHRKTNPSPSISPTRPATPTRMANKARADAPRVPRQVVASMAAYRAVVSADGLVVLPLVVPMGSYRATDSATLVPSSSPSGSICSALYTVALAFSSAFVAPLARQFPVTLVRWVFRFPTTQRPAAMPPPPFPSSPYQTSHVYSAPDGCTDGGATNCRPLASRSVRSSSFRLG